MNMRTKRLISEQDLCVLATCADNRPHCSLMAYVTDPDVSTIYMVTRRETHKFANLMRNPQVSVLIDNRCQAAVGDRTGIQALTLHGSYQQTADETQRRMILGEIMNRHPHLKELAEHDDAELIGIRIEASLFLDGPLHAEYEEH